MKDAGIEERQELELLAGHVLGDLSETESEQVEALLNRSECRSILWELESAAAGVQLSFSPATPMPAGLYDRIRDEGVQMVEGSPAGLPDVKKSAGQGAVETNLQRAVSSNSDAPDENAIRTSSGSSFRGREIVAWLCAAAAVLVAVTLWQPNSTSDVGGQAAASLISQRDELIRDADDLIRVDWGPGTTPIPGEITGDVVWDAKTQKGYMRFVNLPVNDPAVEQYQLWIIDPKRDSNPVDGGVFDITETGEVIVPIDAKLDVISPAAFAITIEQPGGVVVSSQERLPLLAPVEG